MSSTASVYSALAFNGFIFGILTITFEFLRTREVDIYAPRTRGKNPTAPKPQRGLFDWFWQVYHVCDDEILLLAGLDGYVMLRFLLFCTKLCTICSFGAAALIPVYYYAHDTDGVSGIDKLSMANIAPNGLRLWVSMAFMYLFCLAFLYLIHLEYKAFTYARIKFFMGCDHEIPNQMNFSIQVENIPPEFRTSRKLKRFFENIFPNEVMYATVEVAIPELDTTVEQRNALVGKIEEAVAEYECSHRQQRPQMKLFGGKPKLHAYGALCQEDEREVDKIEFLSDQLSVLCAEVSALQAQAVAAVDDMDREMEEVEEQSPLRIQQGNKQAKYDGSFSTTSTIADSSSLAAASPMHISNPHEHSPPKQQQPNDKHPVSRDEANGTGIFSGPDLLLKFGKQTSTVGLKAATAGLKTVTKVSNTALNAISDIKDTIVSNLASATGFVTFKTRRAQVSASQVPVLSQQYPKVTVAAAPAPSDIIWENMSATPEHTEHVSYVTSSMYYSGAHFLIFMLNIFLFFFYLSSMNTKGLLFWSAILASVAALSNLSTLQHYAPWLKLGDITKSILEGLLPVLVMMLFSMLLHWIMDYVARGVEKRKTQSAVQMEIFKWYFMYQIANVYLLLLAGSIFDSLEEAINDPASILRLISSSLPSVSTFFINFIITTWLGGVPLTLLQAVPSALLAFYRCFIKPERMTRPMLKSGPFAPFEVEYGTALPDHLYVLCIVLLYWVISPVILLVAAGFFFSSYMAYKYQFIFVNVRSYESGGQFFYGVYAYSMVGLLAGAVLFIGYMGIKEGVLQAPLLVPLPFLIVYCWRYTEKEFKVMSTNMPFDTAVKADDDISSSEAHDAHEKLLAEFSEDFLKQPNITSPAVVYPYPHRILSVPLLNRHGALNDVYIEDIPAGVDPELYIEQLQISRYQSPTPSV